MRHDATQLDWASMRRGIDAQAELLRSAPPDLYQHAARALPDRLPSRVYLLGCGDSYFCGLATRYATEAWCGVATDATEALEFSRYAVRTAPPRSLAVAVSNSGEVARSVESLRYARQAGMDAVAVTYRTDSRLAGEATAVLPYDYRDVGFGPGTLSYLASALALYAVGLRLGRLAGRLDDDAVAHRIGGLQDLAEVVRATIEAADKPAAELAGRLSGDSDVVFLGGGPNYGTALFAMAKMIETARHNSVAQQLEEWAHEQYFCCGPGSHVVVITPPGASVGRAREQLRAVRDMGGVPVAVCAADDAETAALADIVLPVAGRVDELLSPLAYCVPVELLAYHFGVAGGGTMLGFDDERRREVNFRQIFHSAIPDTVPALGGRR